MCVDKPNIQTWSVARLAFLHKLQWVDSLRNFESDGKIIDFGLQKKWLISIGQVGPPKMVAKRLKMTVNKERDKQFIPLKTGYFICNFVHFLQFALISGEVTMKLSGLETRDCADHETNLQSGYSPTNGFIILTNVPVT